MPIAEFRALFWLLTSVKHPNVLMRAHALDQSLWWATVASMEAKGELA